MRRRFHVIRKKNDKETVIYGEVLTNSTFLGYRKLGKICFYDRLGEYLFIKSFFLQSISKQLLKIVIKEMELLEGNSYA